MDVALERFLWEHILVVIFQMESRQGDATSLFDSVPAQSFLHFCHQMDFEHLLCGKHRVGLQGHSKQDRCGAWLCRTYPRSWFLFTTLLPVSIMVFGIR